MDFADMLKIQEVEHEYFNLKIRVISNLYRNIYL